MRNNQDGNALIGALLSVGVISIVYVATSQYFGDKARVVAATAYASERALIRDMLQSAADCPASLAAAACPSASFPALSRKVLGGPDTTLLAGGVGAPTRIGRWAVRAECAPGRPGFVVRAARLAPAGTLVSTASADFPPEPRLGTTVTWASPESIVFGADAPLCAPHTEAPAAPEAATTCAGTNTGGWCTGGYYQMVKFATPYERAPRVMVSMATPLVQANGCTAQNGGAISVDRSRAYADSVTKDGFRLWCTSSPRDATCPGIIGYARLWLQSRCNWVAFDR